MFKIRNSVDFFFDYKYNIAGYSGQDFDNGMRTVYSNLREAPPVTEGQRLESRALIGYVGDTAISECADRSHLHFELYIGESPADPQKYLTFPSMPS